MNDPRLRCFLRFLLFGCGTSLLACSTASDPASSEDDVVTEPYGAALVACTNPSASANTPGADGEVVSVLVGRDAATYVVEVERWRQLPGFEETLLENAADIVAGVKGKGTRISFPKGGLSLTNGEGGALEASLTWEGKKTTLSCEPRQIVCRSPKRTERPFVTRLAIHPTGHVESFHDVVDAIAGDLSGRISPRAVPDLDAEMTSTMSDAKGVLSAKQTRIEDPSIGTLSVAWDAHAKARVGTLVLSEAFRRAYAVDAVGDAGLPLVCELAEPLSDDAERLLGR